jgi:hypothetical protein
MGDETSTSVAPQEQESTVVSALGGLLPLKMIALLNFLF